MSLDGAHADAGSGGSDAYGGADHVGFCERSRMERISFSPEGVMPLSMRALEASDEVHADCRQLPLEGAGEFLRSPHRWRRCHQ